MLKGRRFFNSNPENLQTKMTIPIYICMLYFHVNQPISLKKQFKKVNFYLILNADKKRNYECNKEYRRSFIFTKLSTKSSRSNVFSKSCSTAISNEILSLSSPHVDRFNSGFDSRFGHVVSFN